MSKANNKRAKPSKPIVPPFIGDHGTGTKAATIGTVMIGLADEHGRNPNNQGQRRRVNRIDEITGLSMRQSQAAKAIQEAFCVVEMMTSGSELKERVDGSPKPDATVAAQVDANSQLVHVMRPVPSAMRGIVEHVCWHNQPINSFRPVNMRSMHSANLKVALELVANHMRY